jgi:hypothetical protein
VAGVAARRGEALQNQTYVIQYSLKLVWWCEQGMCFVLWWCEQGMCFLSPQNCDEGQADAAGWRGRHPGQTARCDAGHCNRKLRGLMDSSFVSASAPAGVRWAKMKAFGFARGFSSSARL